MKKIFFILLFCIVSAFGVRCQAQTVAFRGTVYADTILVGQPFDYQLSLTIPKDFIVEWKQFGDTLSKSIDILQEGELTTTPVANSDNVKMTQMLKMTSFDTGYVYVPEIVIYYKESPTDSVNHRLFTFEKELYVKTVAVDTTQAFRPINNIIKQGVTAKETLPWVVIVIVLIGLTYLTYYFKTHKKPKTVDIPEKKKPTIPAIVTARAKLAEMREKEQWNSSNIKEYYTDLTDIAREYLAGQLNIDAIEMTSDEIMQAVHALDINEIAKSKLQETLITADLVKFAKANPTKDDNEQAFKDIDYFVEDSYAYCQEMEKKRKEEAKK